MTETPILRRYAEALFSAARKQDKTDAVYEDLKSVSSIYAQNPNLEAVLKAPVISADKKKLVISDMFSGKVDSLTLNFMFLVIDKRRDFIISHIFEEFEKLVYDAKGISVAVVESAFKMDEKLLLELKNALEEISGKSVIIGENIVDKSIIGGVRVIMGDNVIDGSVFRKVKEMREFLLKP